MQDAVSLIGNNTAGVLANISSGTLYLAGGNNITLSQNGNSVTISQFPAFESSYENLPGEQYRTMTLNGASISHAVAFQVPCPVSASFLRLPALMTTGSTTISTGATSMNASACYYSTWNAVVYSLGTGASSRSLLSVASGSNGWTWMNSISVATNGSQASITIAYTANALGGSTTRTTQYSVSTSNYPFSTNAFTDYSGARMLDIQFNNSLSDGAYWLVFGYSSSTATNNARMAAATACNMRYSNHYGASQVNSGFGVMGSSNYTSGGYLGCGSFSTAGGGTTSALPLSAISSSASQVRPIFQLLRSA